VIEAFYRQTAAIESDHWWFVHRRALVAQLLARHAPGPYERALDLGCGTGGNIALLASHARVTVGLDRSPLALELARSKDHAGLLVRGDVSRLASTFAPASFDLAASFNVLYHEWVPDVPTALRDVRRVLRTGGCLVLTEPAFEWLRRRHDRIDYGARRFRLRALRDQVRQAGFEVRFASYFNAVSTVPALLRALIERGTGRLDAPLSADEMVGELGEPSLLARSLARAGCALERGALSAGLRLPLGVGLILIARAEGS
jgi:SAM-dependent methyltransferase